MSSWIMCVKEIEVYFASSWLRKWWMIMAVNFQFKHSRFEIRTRDLREYRCDALPTELWSHTLGARSIYWVHISRGFVAQLVEHRTVIRGGHGFESRWSPDFFRLLISNCLNWKPTAMIILHFHAHLQFKYELFHIYFTSSSWLCCFLAKCFTRAVSSLPDPGFSGPMWWSGYGHWGAPVIR